VAVVNSLDSDTVIFIPDEYLAKNVARETGKRIIIPSTETHTINGSNGVNGYAHNGHARVGLSNGSSTRINIALESGTDFNMIGWHGRCEVHEKFTVQDITNVRTQFPDVVILAHPECSPEVVDAADFSGSTTAMIRHVEESNAVRYLLLTECAMADNIVAANPEKEMLRLCSVRCPHMNQITLEDTLDALRYNQYEVHVPEEVRIRAAQSVERMIAIG
jgi:quinolinate synthase